MSASPRPARANPPIQLHNRAIEDLTFIRDTMARAGTVTSVPGWGGVAMGATAHAARTPLLNRAGKLFVRSFVPPILAGAVLTPVFYQAGLTDRLPGLWMLLYGAAVTVAGATSVRAVPLLGMSFMVLGTAAFLLPAGWGDLLMAVGFGGLQIGFGFLIARKYGG